MFLSGSQVWQRWTKNWLFMGLVVAQEQLELGSATAAFQLLYSEVLMSQSVHVDSFLLERFDHTCKPSIGRDRRSLGSLIVSLACLEPSKPMSDPALKDKDPEKQTFPLTSVSTHLCIHMH